MQLAAALPLGCASTAEVLDIWLEGSAPEPEAMLSRLREVAPEGLSVESVEVVDLRGPALQTLTRSAAYEIVVGDAIDRAALVERVEALLARSEIWRERRGKRYNLRSLIHTITVLPGDRPPLRVELGLSQQEGTGRPDEVLDALGLDALTAHVTRTAITFET
jgi:radical SAM-linked protein